MGERTREELKGAVVLAQGNAKAEKGEDLRGVCESNRRVKERMIDMPGKRMGWVWADAAVFKYSRRRSCFSRAVYRARESNKKVPCHVSQGKVRVQTGGVWFGACEHP